jgi:hypothetical protein
MRPQLSLGSPAGCTSVRSRPSTKASTCPPPRAGSGADAVHGGPRAPVRPGLRPAPRAGPDRGRRPESRYRAQEHRRACPACPPPARRRDSSPLRPPVRPRLTATTTANPPAGSLECGGVSSGRSRELVPAR